MVGLGKGCQVLTLNEHVAIYIVGRGTVIVEVMAQAGRAALHRAASQL